MHLMLYISEKKVPNSVKKLHTLYLRRSNFKIEVFKSTFCKVVITSDKVDRIICVNQSYNLKRNKEQWPWAAIYSLGLFVPYNGRKTGIDHQNQYIRFIKRKQPYKMENYQLLNYNDTVNVSHLSTNSVYRLWWPYR